MSAGTDYRGYHIGQGHMGEWLISGIVNSFGSLLEAEAYIDKLLTVQPVNGNTVQVIAPTDNPYWIDSDGNALSVHWEDHFYHENHVVFSPITEKKMTLENMLLIGVIVKLSKTPEGLKVLRDVAVKYLDSCAKIIDSVQAASAQNWLTALNNQHMSAGIAHRIGLLDDGAYLKVVDHYRNVFDKMFTLAAITDTLGSVGTLVQGSRTSTSEREPWGSQAESAAGLGTLIALLKK